MNNLYTSPRFSLYSLPNDKSLEWTKLKAFADDNIDVTQTWKFDLGRVMNIAGEGEIAGYQHFFVLSQCFQKHSFSGSSKEPRGFNPLPNDEIWALTKLKDLADDKFTVAKMLISLFDR